jgi:hypothetical protein
MNDVKIIQMLISLAALTAVIIHIFHFVLIDNFSLVLFVIAIIPWIISLFKPSETKYIHQALISVIAFIGLIIHTIDPKVSIDNVAISLLLISILPWIVPYLGSLNKKTFIQVGISIISFSIIVVHVLWPRLTIDVAIISLFIISILPWIIPFLKSLELPGGYKFEFNNELKEVTQKAEEAGLLPKEANILPKEASLPPIDESELKYSFLLVAETDPNLALAGLRIEIEKRLKDIAKSRDIRLKKPSSVGPVLEALYREGVLSREEKSVILELIYLLNQAVHGAEVDKISARWAISTGLGILNALDDKLENNVSYTLDEQNTTSMSSGEWPYV